MGGYQSWGMNTTLTGGWITTSTTNVVPYTFQVVPAYTFTSEIQVPVERVEKDSFVWLRERVNEIVSYGALEAA